MANRLIKLRLDEVSLVDVPANAGSKIVFFKRKAEMTVKPGIAALAKGLATLFAKAGTPVDENELATQMQAAADGGDSGDGSKPNPAGDPPNPNPNPTDPNPAPVDKGANPFPKKGEETDDEKAKKDKMKKNASIEDRLAALEAENATLAKALETNVTKAKEDADKIAKMAGEIAERDRQGRIEKRSSILKSAGVADADEMSKLLESLPTNAATAMEKRLLADAKIIKASSMFDGLGSTARGDSGAAGSANHEVEELAKKRASEKGIPYAEAFADIWKSVEHADLRKRAEEETSLAKRRYQAGVN